MAHTFLSCEFIGIDISPIYPTEIKPSNVTFQKVNVIEGLPFPDNHFDFVYQRFLTMSLTSSQIEGTLINELVRVLKPGGWLEIMVIVIIQIFLEAVFMWKLDTYCCYLFFNCQETEIGTTNQGPAQKLFMDAGKLKNQIYLN